MSTSRFTGTYTDCGLVSLVAYAPKLEFALTRESVTLDGRLLSARPVVASLSGSNFGVDLVPSDQIIGGTRYQVTGTYLDAAGNFIRVDLFDFYALDGGGRVADMVPRSGLAPAVLIVSETEPDPWPIGWVWANPSTGDVYRKVS